jgi:hypothetical protein
MVLHLALRWDQEMAWRKAKQKALSKVVYLDCLKDHQWAQWTGLQTADTKAYRWVSRMDIWLAE